jgi:hypothetical protein
MSKEILFALLLIPLGALSGQGAIPPGAIAGRTVDSLGAPISGVEVQAGRMTVTSDVGGQFRLEQIGAGRHLIVARRLGFSPESLLVTVDLQRVDTVRFVLHAVASTLDGVDIIGTSASSARLKGFESRRARKNGGQFVTREDIDRRMPLVASDILRRLQGLRVVDSMGVQLAVSTRGPKPDLRNPRPMAPCVLRIGVDGSLKEPYFPVNTVVVGDIHGIEVYSGPATMPPEFGGARRDAGCGLIMIWTRSR